VLGYNFTYFSNKIQKGKTCYSEEQVISMLEFFIDNIFVSLGGTLFQQVVGIPMGTNCGIDNSFVEQVDDPAMYLSLNGVLWSLGIQYK
jgi:hypothetical protein